MLSPLLANVYLHWFDHLFYREEGPGQWAKAQLVRYAADFVVVAQYISPQLTHWIDGKHTPLPELIGRVNRPRKGWAKYFGLGYPRKAFRQRNHFVRSRLGQHLHRRRQRSWRAREGVSLYAHLNHLGLVNL